MKDNKTPTPSPFPQPSDGNKVQAILTTPMQEPEEPIPPEDVQADQVVVLPAVPSGQVGPKAGGPALKGNVTCATPYFMSGSFGQDIANYQTYSNRMTGYDNLDRTQPFYPGFYALGAISSLGKTTFAHQLADQVAAHGEGVLYFSLEQNHFELFSKSLSRGFFYTYAAEMQKNGVSTYPTPSSIDIRRGIADSYPDKLAEQKAAYANMVGNRLFVIDGAFSLTVEDIVSDIEIFIAVTGNCKPVVIIDYLQIVAPSTVGGRQLEAKASIDHIVHTLKAIQSKYNMTVIVISSMNRQNYMTPVDFESFKESGGIEYTADVVWGLQLTAMNHEIFAKEGKVKEKRDMLRDAKAKTPREVDLVCLKNRYGRSSYSVSFDYFPASDVFVPVCGPLAGIGGIPAKVN